jgi:hypothetical protein
MGCVVPTGDHDGHEIVYVACVQTRRIMSVSLGIGSRLSAFCISMGRALLAQLPPEELEKYFRTAKFRRFTEKTICDPGGSVLWFGYRQHRAKLVPPYLAWVLRVPRQNPFLFLGGKISRSSLITNARRHDLGMNGLTMTEIMEEVRNNRVILLDLRDQDEYRAGPIMPFMKC